MSRTNETRFIKWHETCKCVCRLDGIKTINGEKELIYEKNYGKKYREAKKPKNNEQDSVCTIF